MCGLCVQHYMRRVQRSPHLKTVQLLDVCSVAGDSRLQVGQKLRFSMPLPHSHEELMSLLTPTKEMVTDVVKDRIRSERAKGKQEITLAEPVQAPPQLNTAVQTAK